MKRLGGVVFLLAAFLLISAGDASANGYYGPRSYHDCYPSYGFSFGFYGGYSPYIPYYGYYPYSGYRPYYGYYSRPYYGGYGYYNRPYHYGGGYGYYGRSYRYNRPYSYRSYRRYPRIQKPYSSRGSGSRVIRRH